MPVIDGINGSNTCINVLPPTKYGSIDVLRGGMTGNLESVRNENNGDDVHFPGSTATTSSDDVHFPGSTATTSSVKRTLANVLKFIQNVGPNHVIVQAGPQIHNALTGMDFKFTPTAVIASDHVELYPLHHEIGYAFPSSEGAHAKGYALGVHQQGINFDWNNRKLSYVRQMLGRVEVDFPYGVPGLQGTIGFEVGITDKTKGLSNALLHAKSDFQTSSAQALALTGIDFSANPDLIKIITGGLIGAFAIPEVISRLKNPDNSRESVLWMGLSVGYCDYNGTLLHDLKVLQDNQHRGVNIQGNVYVRHGEMITYDFQNKQFTIPYALTKALVLLSGGCKPEFLRRILSSQTDINHRVCQGDISTEAGLTVNDFLDETAAAGCHFMDNNNTQSLGQEHPATHTS